MKIGVYSDVHANLKALKAVLSVYEGMSDIDWFVCLGDVVGYGSSPDQCCDLVKEQVRFAVLGNHDAAVSGRMNYSYYYPAARMALDHHITAMKKENLQWLADLPYTVMVENIWFSHGCPINPESFEYVFIPEHAEALLEYWDELPWVSLIGHSHLTKSFKLMPAEDNVSRVQELTGSTLSLEPSAKYIITVGSVGQPRDNDYRACLTVLDTDEKTLTFHRADYDVFGSAEEIWSNEHLASDFGKRLFLGV
ncbi:MAG: metallophosphoesterase [Bradymonadales bacterium]|nr:metallophosphoesterase [Bradymonadales bacterium]